MRTVMIEPVTMSLAAWFLYRTTSGEGLIAKVLEDRFGESSLAITEKIINSVRDALSAGKLPTQDPLRQAALDSLRRAAMVLSDALACRLDPKLQQGDLLSRVRRRLIAAEESGSLQQDD